MPRQPALAVVPLLVIAATLVGCAEPTRLPPPEPSAAEAPLFSSDEEALAAATAAYEEYLAVSNLVFSEPPRDLSPLSDITTPEFLENERELAHLLNENGWTISGGSQLVGVELQQWFGDRLNSVTLLIYACVDVSESRILDLDGADVTPADRSEAVTLEVEMVGDSEGDLRVSRSELWANSQTCT